MKLIGRGSSIRRNSEARAWRFVGTIISPVPALTMIQDKRLCCFYKIKFNQSCQTIYGV